MKLFGLIGYPLGHSFSQGYFRKKFSSENISDCAYQNFPISDISQFPKLIENTPELIGLNVTIPYKSTIIHYLDSLSEASRAVGAVNTVKISRKDSEIYLKGFNTDVNGFEQSLDYLKVKVPSEVLVLGNGGAAKAVLWVLQKYPCTVKLVTRNPQEENQIAYSELVKSGLDNFRLIINTTPLGMHPHIEQCPDLPYDSLTKDHVLFDLIYNPEETLFLKKGKEKGCKTINGLHMLRQQAEKSWEIWNDPAF